MKNCDTIILSKVILSHSIELLSTLRISYPAYSQLLSCYQVFRIQVRHFRNDDGYTYYRYT